MMNNFLAFLKFASNSLLRTRLAEGTSVGLLKGLLGRDLNLESSRRRLCCLIGLIGTRRVLARRVWEDED